MTRCSLCHFGTFIRAFSIRSIFFFCFIRILFISIYHPIHNLGYSNSIPLFSIMAHNLGHHTKPLKSKVNTKSTEYRANYKEMLGLVDQLNERLQEATFQGEQRLLDLHHKRGGLLGMKIQLIRLVLQHSLKLAHY